MPTNVYFQDPKNSVAKPGSFENTRVYVLDDDLSILRALERLLKSDGFDVKTFSHPAVFLANIGQGGCQVAILDVEMPGMNGLHVKSALRQRFPEARIIFISGRDEPSVRRNALEAGAFGFLSKPIDDEELLKLVRMAVAG